VNMSETRPALYYPYIHVRNEDWLKATLLCVPVVKRILPANYEPEDAFNIVPYTKIKGPNGELLQPVPAGSPETDAAQARLLEKLKTHATLIHARFGRERAPRADEYWIHDAKFSNTLLEYLRTRNLAWESADPLAHGHRKWFALHPTLGSAIMTTIGLSIARAEDYDIVTPSNRVHDSLLAVKEEAIFETLIRDESDALDSPRPEQIRHELGQLVIALSGINFQALKPEDIPELQDSHNFGRFQALIRRTATNVERDKGPKAYERSLKHGAQEIIDAWHETDMSLSRKIRNALFQQGVTAAAPAVPFLPGVRDLAEAPNLVTLAAAGAVAVVLATWEVAGLVREQRRGPYRYLTEVNRAQDESLRLTFPLGLGR
jgi:hypothetical protein